ncbi:MAG: ECF transporter S component [Promethearchaeota archaeon]
MDASNSVKKRVIQAESQSISLKIAISSIMAALTCVVTMMISIYIPATQGFFNIGESIVYLSAILWGPYIGLIAGGIGSMTADLLLGYPFYAPGTLIIKGLEGFIVGYIYQKLRLKELEKGNKNYIILVISSLLSISILIIGFVFYIGEAEVSGFIYIIWILIAIISFIGINLINKYIDPTVSMKIISMFFGGVVMVLGYLLYCSFIMNNVMAYVEIPFNILQCLIGTIIAVPLITPIKKRLNFAL